MAKQKRSLTDRVQQPEKTQITAEAQEMALEKLQNGGKTLKKKKVRVSVDFPIDLYETMKEDTENNGQTHRGFIVSLVKQYYNK